MDIGKVAAVSKQSIDGRLGLALEIGIDGAGGPLHLADLHTRAHGNALE